MALWSESFIKVNGMKLHYYRTGGDKPSVVMNHGAGDDGLCWTRVAKALEQDYDIILPDARGHGKSSNGKGNYGVEQRVSDLAALIQSLKLDRPVVGGHSMGADTSLHLAAMLPELTRGIFLEDPPIIQPGEVFGDGKQNMKMEDLGKMMSRFMLIFKLLPNYISLPMSRKNNPTYPDDDIIPWVNSKQRVSFDFLNSMASLGINISEPFTVFQKVTVPILLFTGDKQKMSIVSQASAEAAVKANPRVKVVHLEGASHDIRRTRYDGYIPALQQFLAETNR